MVKGWGTLICSLCILLMISCTQTDTTGTIDQIDAALVAAASEGKAVMLELGSVGCVPCERMKPVMDKLSRDYEGTLAVIFIDVRENKRAGRRFGVTMIPTQVFLDNKGNEFHRHIGFYAYEEIVPVLKGQGL